MQHRDCRVAFTTKVSPRSQRHCRLQHVPIPSHGNFEPLITNMAPPSQTAREPSIPSTSEYAEFIRKLAAYHEKRGTNFEPEPKVANRRIDLLHLFNLVVDRGGYDKVSDEKLAWRKLAGEFHLGNANLPAYAFTLKSAYYKNLAAFEITTVHGKEPPPKEILEETTAKGSGLLTRTLENYRPSVRRETSALGIDSDGSGDESGTPTRDTMATEETPGSGGRATRGLRQAPPPRQMWQPEPQSSRQTRNLNASSHTSTAQQHHGQQQQQSQQQQLRGASTSYNPSSNTDNMSLAVANYEPRPQMPLTLRQVITPGNSAVEFARLQKVLKDAAAAGHGRTLASTKGIMLPGTGFDGPNIYVRCLCALRSGIPAEQDYALHHLVKISMERGDKYRFEGFPGLAEALVEKVLEVSSLFYNVDWEISYTDDGEMVSGDVINGLTGTPDILERIAALSKLKVDDNIHTAEFSDKMLQINEAALTLRNMVMLEENALYVHELSPLRDFLSIALNLPNLESLVELKHYALDIAEQMTKYLHLGETDPLYISLLNQLNSNDRGAILTALRAIGRISMNLEENNLLQGVPLRAIQNIIDWTMLHDEDLVHACLDFLYQYTAVVKNVDFLISELQVEPLINQLVRLLHYGVKIVEREIYYAREIKRPAPTTLPALPKEIFSQLVQVEEPERSSQWLRCLFEEDPDESITQITLWQAYQACFTLPPGSSNVAMLAAADFIKNVSTTFEKAAAQVQSGIAPKFIIKGIRMRSVPVDPKGEEASKCLWQGPFGGAEPCGQFFMSPETMFQHILREHLGARQLEDGKFENTSNRQYKCLWDRCHRFKSAPATKLLDIANHIKVHLPPRHVPRNEPEHSGPPPAKKSKPSYIISAPKRSLIFQVTAQDERSEAAGIPLSAVLVLRNLARNISKTDAEATTKTEGGVSWLDRLFKPVEPRLFEILAHNKSLAVYITDLVGAIKS
ncbi:Chromatin structure-remodeling complex protein rsc9 [Cadophora gregata f. sp. sojae]|nr:Chromatin structure-remodeling complex protein rsc9 [Cadophora gregata f. sp. sojae]